MGIGDKGILHASLVGARMCKASQCWRVLLNMCDDIMDAGQGTGDAVGPRSPALGSSLRASPTHACYGPGRLQNTLTIEILGKEDKMKALTDLLEPYGEPQGLARAQGLATARGIRHGPGAPGLVHACIWPAGPGAAGNVYACAAPAFLLFVDDVRCV